MIAQSLSDVSLFIKPCQQIKSQKDQATLMNGFASFMYNQSEIRQKETPSAFD
jgi:hypothetical protein